MRGSVSDDIGTGWASLKEFLLLANEEEDDNSEVTKAAFLNRRKMDLYNSE